MRTCRLVYTEVLDLLYGYNTVSFFGSEIVPFFVRNASPEGLLRIRYVPVALSIQSLNWSMPRNKTSVLDTIHCINESMATSLRQLDIEVVLTHGQPSEPQQFWAWLVQALSSNFHGLGRFVLKVSVIRPDHVIIKSEEDERRYMLEIQELHDRILGGEEDYLTRVPKRTHLITWSGPEYVMLKEKVTQSPV